MQARLMIPMLLLSAVAGCARSTEVAGSAPGAGDTVPQAGEAAPGRAASSAGSASAPTSVQASAQTSAQASAPVPRSDGASEGIRVGEPDPHGKPWQRAGARMRGQGWHAFGNEPFWSVQARGATLVFTTPENQAGVTLAGRRVPSLVGTVILGSGPKGEFHFGVTPGECSDGMSDRSYDFASTFIYAGTTYKGCAEPVDAP